MGHLHYGSPPASFELDDRELAHLELVIVAKLRRGENLAVTLPAHGGGRSTIWVGIASDLRFEYQTDQVEINREWLEQLMDSANTTAGLRPVPEPGGS